MKFVERVRGIIKVDKKNMAKIYKYIKLLKNKLSKCTFFFWVSVSSLLHFMEKGFTSHPVKFHL